MGGGGARPGFFLKDFPYKLLYMGTRGSKQMLVLSILAFIFLNKQERGATGGQRVSTLEASESNARFASPRKCQGPRRTMQIGDTCKQELGLDGLSTKVLRGHCGIRVLGRSLPASDLSPPGAHPCCSIPEGATLHVDAQHIIRKLLRLSPCSRNVATTSSPLGSPRDDCDHT